MSLFGAVWEADRLSDRQMDRERGKKNNVKMRD